MAAITAPHPEEQRHDPRAWQEGAQAAQKLSKEHVVEVIKEQKAESEENNRELRTRWALWWDLWENKVDLQDKEAWQAQVWVPKPYTTVEQATGLVQRAVVDSPEFWGMEGTDRRDQQLATAVWRPILKVLLGKAHFSTKYLDAVKCGFITGVAGYLKFRWPTTAVKQLQGASFDPATGQTRPVYGQRLRSSLAVDWIDPRKIYRDPDAKPREQFSGAYLYHTEWKNRADLRAMQEAGWNADAIQRVLDTGTGSTSVNPTRTPSDEQAYDQDAGKWRRSKFRQAVLVDEGWHDLPNEHGDIVFPDALTVHGGGELLYGPVENPLWAVDLQTGRRKWPFLAGVPLGHPKRFEGRGVVEQITDLAWVYSNLFMLFLDGMNWVVNPPTEIQQDALVDPDDLSHYPGKLWVRRGAGAQAALAMAQVGRLDVGSILAALSYIEQVTQNSSFVTDFAIGLPGNRSDITLGEVQVKTAQSLSIFEAIGRNLEALGRDGVELAYDMSVQFLSESSDPSIAAILGDANAAWLAQASLDQRMAALQGNFDFTFTGVTQALQKSDQLAKLGEFGKLAGAMPYVQLLGTTQPQVFMEILEAYRDILGLGDRIHIQSPTPAQQGMVPGGMAQPGMPPGIDPATAAMGLPPEILQALLGGGGGAPPTPAGPPQGRANLATANGVGAT